VFGESFKKIALADPEVSNLRDKSVYFYEFGLKLAEKLEYNSTIFELLTHVFFGRMKKLMSLMNHMEETQESGFLQRLTEIEDGIFQKGIKLLDGFKFAKKQGTLTESHRNIIRGRKRLKQTTNY